MKEQDKLRQTLQEYYDSQEAPYSHNEWEKASAYLNAARRKRKAWRLAVIFITLLGTLIVGWFNFKAFIGKEKQEASLPVPSKAAPVKRLGAYHSFKGSTPNAATSVTSSYNKASNTSITALTLTSQQQKTVPVTQTKSPVNKVPAAQAPVVTKSLPALIEKNDAAKDRANTAATTPANMATSAVDQIGIKLDATNDTTGKEENLPVLREQAAEQDKTPAPTKNQPTVIALSQDIILPNTKNEITMADTSQLKTPGQLPTVALVIANVVAINDTIVTGTGTDSLPGSLLFEQLANEGLFYEAGAAWLYGWKSANGHRDARGFSPVAGINYMNSLGSRYAFSFGLQYMQVRNLSGSSKTSRVSSYKYGEQSAVTVITPSTLHYMVAPLRLHYYADNRNSFGIGANLAYLLNVDARVTSYIEGQGYNKDQKTMQRSGYTEGFSWFDSQVAVFYRRRLAGSLALQAEIFMGLTDIKNNDFFTLNYKERNSGLKLSLVYFTSKKNK